MLKSVYAFLIVVGTLIVVSCTPADEVDVSRYHQLVNKAELSICDSDYAQASDYYSSAFQVIKKPFGNDVFNAILSDALANNIERRDGNLQLLINNMSDYEFVISSLIPRYVSEQEWNKLLALKEVGYDEELAKEFVEIKDRDQLFRPMYDTHDDTIQANRIINMNRILELTESDGFPSQEKLGYMKNLRGQNHHIVLHHNAQRRSTDKSAIDLEPLLLQAVKQGRFDPERAMMYLNFQSDLEKGHFEVYNVMQYAQGNLPDSLNNKIWLPNLTQQQIDDANGRRAEWLANSISDISTKADFLAKTDIPFIFTSVQKSIFNLPDDLDETTALGMYEAFTMDKVEFDRTIAKIKR